MRDVTNSAMEALLLARTATRSDLAKVFRNLSDRMLDEYEAAGLNQSQAKSAVRKLVDSRNAHALVHNDDVLAVIGWWADGKTAYTSFAAVERFFLPMHVKFTKRHIHSLQKELGGIALHSYSFSSDPRARKWFRVIGFREPMRTTQCDTVYVLPPQGD